MELIKPSKKYYDSYIEAMNALNYDKVNDMSKEELFKRFEDRSKGINLPEGWIPATTYWLVDNNEFIGQISIRHKLTKNLERYAGHIGYSINPKYWNQGYGTKMLELGLKKAKNIIKDEKVLITCDDDNIASAKVIEKNGGLLQDKVKNTIDGKEIISRRYWIKIR